LLHTVLFRNKQEIIVHTKHIIIPAFITLMQISFPRISTYLLTYRLTKPAYISPSNTITDQSIIHHQRLNLWIQPNIRNWNKLTEFFLMSVAIQSKPTWCVILPTIIVN